jgi:hypothetical protein
VSVADRDVASGARDSLGLAEGDDHVGGELEGVEPADDIEAVFTPQQTLDRADAQMRPRTRRRSRSCPLAASMPCEAGVRSAAAETTASTRSRA